MCFLLTKWKKGFIELSVTNNVNNTNVFFNLLAIKLKPFNFILTPTIFAVGTLLDCYDELGAHYQLPVYCLSPPVNLIKDELSSPVVCDEDMKDIKEGDP